MRLTCITVGEMLWWLLLSGMTAGGDGDGGESPADHQQTLS